MPRWPDHRLTELLGIQLPLIQAPMLGAGSALMVGVAQAGGLGSLACATLTLAQVEDEVTRFRAASSAPLNLNFFCHTPAVFDEQVETRWKASLADYYREVGADLTHPRHSPTARRLTKRPACWWKNCGRKSSAFTLACRRSIGWNG